MINDWYYLQYKWKARWCFPFFFYFWLVFPLKQSCLCVMQDFVLLTSCCGRVRNHNLQIIIPEQLLHLQNKLVVGFICHKLNSNTNFVTSLNTAYQEVQQLKMDWFYVTLLTRNWRGIQITWQKHKGYPKWFKSHTHTRI